VSAPRYVPRPPRGLTGRELQAALKIADALIPDGPAGPRPSAIQDYPKWLELALAARRDSFDEIIGLVAELADCATDSLYERLKQLSETSASGFEVLSSVLAGAYLVTPEVRGAIGYPGQAQRAPRFDEAADQIMSGILDPVIERGAIFRPTDSVDGPNRDN
jgi:hypothetical protein